ncbi:hypothetical protein MYO4S_00032 [Serratia phage 4S]|nr:hypothetical protein MYO4S_00032 [Serratia phage 4S]
MIVQTKLKFLKKDSGFTTDKEGRDMHIVDRPSFGVMGVNSPDNSRIFEIVAKPNDLVWADSSRVRTFWQRVFGLNK